MEKKYILTDETKIIGAHVLHRIQALKSFEDVNKGDLGGWIEKEENLDHEGTCWVYDEAMVFGEAEVYDEACLYGEARVYEKARVRGEARVYEKARVCGEAKVYGMASVGLNSLVQSNYDIKVIGPIGSRSGFTTFTKSKSGDILVFCGCFKGDIKPFEARVRRNHEGTTHEKDYMAAISYVKRALS